jgi:hypothetical protein
MERKCLFCGRPLSRIRFGGGEEFCSRQHRAQYRLRRGMDRLHEANQIATLMRRREVPKPIAVSPRVSPGTPKAIPALPHGIRPVRIPRFRGKPGWTREIAAAGYVEPVAAVGGSSGIARWAQEYFRAVPLQAVLPRRLPVFRKVGSNEIPLSFCTVSGQPLAGKVLKVSRSLGFHVSRAGVTRRPFAGAIGRPLPRPEFLRIRTTFSSPCMAAPREYAERMGGGPMVTAVRDAPWTTPLASGPGCQPPGFLSIQVSGRAECAAARISIIEPSCQASVYLPNKARIAGRAGWRTGFFALTPQSLPGGGDCNPRLSVIPLGANDKTIGWSEEE